VYRVAFTDAAALSSCAHGTGLGLCPQSALGRTAGSVCTPARRHRGQASGVHAEDIAQRLPHVENHMEKEGRDYSTWVNSDPAQAVLLA
jgi:hypothetical protein